jgi:ribosomal-protein-alanine N-acetyltransferase
MIERASFNEERFQRWLLESMIGEKTFMTLVALEEKEVVGYGSVHLSGAPARIISIAVLPDKRGRGLGRSLLEALENDCLAKSIMSLCLEVSISNLVALHLYLSKGYEVKGIIHGYYGDGKDAFYMVKVLSEKEERNQR